MTPSIEKGKDVREQKVTSIKNDNPVIEEATYVVSELPMGVHRPCRVVCMGAGYSGIMMGIVHKNRMAHNNVEFVVYERHNELGGTWLENRYPGCQW